MKKCHGLPKRHCAVQYSQLSNNDGVAFEVDTYIYCQLFVLTVLSLLNPFLFLRL